MDNRNLKFKNLFKPSTYTNKINGKWTLGLLDTKKSGTNYSFGLSPGKDNKITPSELVASCCIKMMCGTIALPILLVMAIVYTACVLFFGTIGMLSLCCGSAYQKAKWEKNVEDCKTAYSGLAISCGLFIGSAVLFVASTLLLPFEGAARIYDACVQGGNEPAQAK